MSVITDPKYMATASVAMGISALIQNAIRAVCLLAIPLKTLLEVSIFYIVSSIILVFAAFAYFIERRNQFAIYHIAKLEDRPS